MAKVEIPKIDLRTIKVEIVGTTPLIVHRWSEKIKKEILGKKLGKAKQGKHDKDWTPEKEFNAARYMSNGKDYFKAISIKQAMVRAANDVGIKMTEAKRYFRVCGEFIPEYGEEFIEINASKDSPVIREDDVRVGMGSADLRYRPMYLDWSCQVEILYNHSVITPEAIINLLNTAGFGVGICEWRPSSPKCSGSFGCFVVKTRNE